VLALLRPSRRLLVVGAVGNLAIVALWGVTRTVGIPIGPTPWRPEAVGTADALAVQLELALALGATWLLARGGQRAPLAAPVSHA
jgi:putative NADH-flavin reductase